VSLVITVYNEINSLVDLFDSISRQLTPPREVIIVDAGSTDGSLDYINSQHEHFQQMNINLRVIVSKGANIAKGRNIGISESSEDVIAITDAGCRLKDDWYQQITEQLVLNNADFVGGFFKPVAVGKTQSILAALTTTSKPTSSFIPSSRSIAFKKEIWRKAGGYPEDLRWGEDTLFAKRCIKQGRYHIAGDAIVHWKVRSGFREIWLQFFRYSLGDGEAATSSRSLTINQVVGWAAIILMVFSQPIFAVSLWFLYLATLIFRKRKNLQLTDIPLATLIIFSIQGSRFIGYIYGFARRIVTGIRP